MVHPLEQFVTKISISNYAETLQCYGDNNLDNLSELFTGLTEPFNSQNNAETFWKAVLLENFGNVEILSWWNIRLDPEQEMPQSINTELGWDEDDNIGQYTAVLHSKLNPSFHKPIYFADNKYRATEYKPENIVEGDCLVFPSNIYYRNPLNKSQESSILSVCTFRVI